MPSLLAEIVNKFQEVHKGGLILTKQMAPVELPLTPPRAKGKHRPNDRLSNSGINTEERSFGSGGPGSHERPTRSRSTLTTNFQG
jgi:hypothetical protein